MRHVAVRGADGDGQVGVAGIVDGEVQPRSDDALLLALREAIARVAGGDDDDHARADQPVHLHAERTLPAGEPLRLEVVPHAQVDPVHEDPPPVPVQLLDVLDGRDDAAGPARAVALAVGVEHLQAQQLAARRHTGDGVEPLGDIGGLAILVAVSSGCHDRAVLLAHLASDDSGDVGSVSVHVDERLLLARCEVAVGERRRQIEIPVLTKMSVVSVDTRIDDRPDDVSPDGGERVVRGVRLDRADRLVDQRLELEVRPDVIDGPIGLALPAARIAADELAHRVAVERGEDVLVPLGQRVADTLLCGILLQVPHEILDHLLDDSPRAFDAVAELEVQIDDDVEHSGAVFLALELFEQGDRDDRPVEDPREESHFIGFLALVASLARCRAPLRSRWSHDFVPPQGGCLNGVTSGRSACPGQLKVEIRPDSPVRRTGGVPESGDSRLPSLPSLDGFLFRARDAQDIPQAVVPFMAGVLVDRFVGFHKWKRDRPRCRPGR